MKLAGDAKHDPVNGIWARVCMKCFQNRVGYNDSRGVVRIRSGMFLKLRASKLAQTLMECNKIELRLTKTIKLNKEDVKSQSFYGLESISKLITKDSRNSIVEWIPDNQDVCCLICKSHFTFISRRHHCRLCGNLICSTCLTNLTISNASNLKVCKDCNYLLTLYFNIN